MRALTLPLILLAALAAPALTGPAEAQVPTLARCNQLYCFSLIDEDGDGTPDALVGGTTSFLHEAPTANAMAGRDRALLASETRIGHEDEASQLVTTYAYVELADDAPGLRTAYVDVDAAEEDGEGGAARQVLRIVVHAEDADGDGVPERGTYELLP